MRPVVLLHGWGGSFASTWERAGWPEALTVQGRKVIAINLPGHGGAASHDPADYADLAHALSTRLPVGPLDVIAYSLGAKLVLSLAANDDARFGKIVLGGVGDNVFAPEPSADALAVALGDGVDANTPPAMAALARYAIANGNDPAVMAAILNRPPNPVFAEGDLANIANVCLINGANDGIALPDLRLRASLPGTRYIALPDVDHLSLPSHPAFRTAALDFLDKD